MCLILSSRLSLLNASMNLKTIGVMFETATYHHLCFVAQCAIICVQQLHMKWMYNSLAITPMKPIDFILNGEMVIFPEVNLDNKSLFIQVKL